MLMSCDIQVFFTSVVKKQTEINGPILCWVLPYNTTVCCVLASCTIVVSLCYSFLCMVPHDLGIASSSIEWVGWVFLGSGFSV